MKAELYKRLFRAIFSEDIPSLKKIAGTIIQEERRLGHNVLADALEKISITEKPKQVLFDTRKKETGLSALPKSKRTNSQLVSYIPREQLKHHMVLPDNVEERLLSIEKEYAAKERLEKYNLKPKKKILLYGPPGCGKTLSAERIAWNLGLPLLKVRFDSLLSSYFGESASNLRMVFDYCKTEPVVLLLDECDFIAKSRTMMHLKVSLDEALFRRFDDVIEMPMPGKEERKRLLNMTLSAIPVSPDVDMDRVAEQLDGYSAANVVLVAQRAAKIGVLAGYKKVCKDHFSKALEESAKF